jgi:hypothetical protein
MPNYSNYHRRAAALITESISTNHNYHWFIHRLLLLATLLTNFFGIFQSGHSGHTARNNFLRRNVFSPPHSRTSFVSCFVFVTSFSYCIFGVSSLFINLVETAEEFLVICIFYLVANTFEFEVLVDIQCTEKSQYEV